MAEDCLFCGIVEGSVPSQTIDSDERTVAFMDINPATPGHALVVPRVHSADLMEIEPEDLEATTLAARRLSRRMKEVLDADGINVLNACT
jgi:histidine triad (HIT) family protein